MNGWRLLADFDETRIASSAKRSCERWETHHDVPKNSNVVRFFRALARWEISIRGVHNRHKASGEKQVKA